MKFKVDEDWWQYLFDEIYLLTDARSINNEELSSREVDFLVETLHLDESAQILDMCGGHGRHALELSRRGFKNVTVLDYSSYLIELGKKKAKEEKLNTVFIKGDARNTGLPGRSFHFIVIMASSFGYFINEADNKKILDEAFRLLRLGGTLLLDLPDKEYLLQNFKSSSSHDVNEEITVVREKELGNNIIYSRERVLSKRDGCIRDRTYCTHLYSPDQISAMLHSAGFSTITCLSNFMNRAAEGDFGCMTNRMIVTAIRA